MNADSLPARIIYAAVTLPLAGAAGFYASLWLIPKVALHFQGADADLDGYRIFSIALWVGAGLAWTASLVALTLPWKRRRRRVGRTRRIALAAVFVVLTSMAFAAESDALLYDLAFASWLGYVMAYTFVRYGVADGGKPSTSAN